MAEAIGYLNGIIYPDYVSVAALAVKFLGVMFAVAAGLCGGKEGPLVHLGACMGILILYIPLGLFNYYRNEHDKRKFFAMGIGAGISAAFGAPIGGSLFAYELTKPNTFWTFSLTWRVFFCCSICTFFLNIFKSIQNGSGINITYAGLVKLGDSNAQTDLSDIPASIIIGIIGGLMGSGFIFFNA